MERLPHTEATTIESGQPMPELLTPEQAGELLEISPSTLRKWRSLREGPTYTKVGGSVRYLRDDLVAYLHERRHVLSLSAEQESTADAS